LRNGVAKSSPEVVCFLGHLQLEIQRVSKDRDMTVAKLKTVEKQKADVEAARDDLRCACLLGRLTWRACATGRQRESRTDDSSCEDVLEAGVRLAESR
jgi:hypothetical protein